MKKNKSKKNWLKVQFEKYPYVYSILILWIISWSLIFWVKLYYLQKHNQSSYIDSFYRLIKNPDFISFFGFTTAVTLYLGTPIIFFLWLYKNKSKIKPFFKSKSKKNWFKVQFEKNPYICFLVALIISFALNILAEIFMIKVLADFFGLIFYSLPLVAIIYWIFKNYKKHPYICFLIAWITFLFLSRYFTKLFVYSRFNIFEVLMTFFSLMIWIIPILAIFLLFRKNKPKIKYSYKIKKKKNLKKKQIIKNYK